MDFYTNVNRLGRRLGGDLIVGEGLAPPEVCTLYNSGRVTSINAERGNLGTSKLVPYKNLANCQLLPKIKSPRQIPLTY